MDWQRAQPSLQILDDHGTILFNWPGNSIQEYFFADDNPHVGGEFGGGVNPKMAQKVESDVATGQPRIIYSST